MIREAIWKHGHRYYPMLGDWCRVCDRETRSHHPLCPVWLLRPR
jgi:hypothetical protein